MSSLNVEIYESRCAHAGRKERALPGRKRAVTTPCLTSERNSMLEQIQSDDATDRRAPGQAYLCLHGHFYQPPRENPFTNQIPPEPAATPFANFNEKITVECYAPNA